MAAAAVPAAQATPAGVAEEPPPAPSASAEEPAPPPEEERFSTERCATIAARLAQRPSMRATILDEEGLTSERWELVHDERLSEIQDELRRGKKQQLSAYDTAYVAALEATRGPITAREYARLVIAAERGHVEADLSELGLPEDAMMRIRRVWLAKVVKDPKLAAAVRAALQTASEG